MKNTCVCMVALLLLAGCAIPPVLVEKPNVPVFVNSYESPTVSRQTKSLKCRLNLVNCVETAAVGAKTLSGKTETEQTFEVRPIVGSEFGNVVRENFSPVEGSEQPNIELKIETQKVLLTRDGKKFTFTFAAAVKLLNPSHEDKPYFSKIYSVTKRNKSEDRAHVPDCVYEAIQDVLYQFLQDLGKDASLLTELNSLTK